ncbi:hypothetical protein LTR36_003536 [Oleoguttula mirabilis]|uniref:Uncharacterized protein n=1 Tax=Oleoguttula mirabilis TaxID=1507867 RepID=A0AAV9JIW5_9PEZI|nr:hypothetical protein LTR36_003536 [Oleoguttula mirabilis]
MHVRNVKDALALLAKADLMTSSLADVVILEAHAGLDKHLNPLLDSVGVFLAQDFALLPPGVRGGRGQSSRRKLCARTKLRGAYDHLLASAKAHAGWKGLECEDGRKGVDRMATAMETALLDLAEIPLSRQ